MFCHRRDLTGRRHRRPDDHPVAPQPLPAPDRACRSDRERPGTAPPQPREPTMLLHHVLSKTAWDEACRSGGAPPPNCGGTASCIAARRSNSPSFCAGTSPEPQTCSCSPSKPTKRRAFCNGSPANPISRRFRTFTDPSPAAPCAVRRHRDPAGMHARRIADPRSMPPRPAKHLRPQRPPHTSPSPRRPIEPGTNGGNHGIRTDHLQVMAPPPSSR